MLITGELYELMTEKNKEHLRLIDRVSVDGEDRPTDLYTVDVNPKHLFSEMGVDPEKNLTSKEKRLAKVEQSVERKHLIESIENNAATTMELWNDE